MAKETKEVVKQETQLPSTEVQSLQDMGLSAGDMAIPKLLIMQGTSERVGDGKSAFGDIINSLTNEKLGDFTKGVEFIPLMVQKTWVTFDTSVKPPEFLRVENFTPANADWSWEAEENGKSIRRDQCLDYYALICSEIAKGEAFPCVISFRRTSYRAGKILATHLIKLNMFRQLPYSKRVSLGLDRQKEGTNTYGVYTVTPGVATTPEEQAMCKQWLDLLKTTRYAVDQSDLRQAEAAAPVPAVEPVVVGKGAAIY